MRLSNFRKPLGQTIKSVYQIIADDAQRNLETQLRIKDALNEEIKNDGAYITIKDKHWICTWVNNTYGFSAPTLKGLEEGLCLLVDSIVNNSEALTVSFRSPLKAHYDDQTGHYSVHTRFTRIGHQGDLGSEIKRCKRKKSK